MAAYLLSGPEAEPVSVGRLREHLRLGAGEDALLSGLIVAARMTVEAQSGLRLMTQDWRVVLDDWPQAALELPVAPVRQVKAVEVVNGKRTRLAESNFRLEAQPHPPRLYFVGNNMPRPQMPQHGIHVTLAVGFGDEAAHVPQDLQLAVLHLAAHWYDVDDCGHSQAARTLPPHIIGLMDNYRVPRL